MVDFSIPKPKPITSWWFQPIWKIFVKLDHFPRVRDEKKKIFELPPPRIKSDCFIQHPGPEITPLTSQIQITPPPPWADFARGNISWKSKPARHNCNLKRPAKRPTGIGGDTWQFLTRTRFPEVPGSLKGRVCRFHEQFIGWWDVLEGYWWYILQQSYEVS